MNERVVKYIALLVLSSTGPDSSDLNDRLDAAWDALEPGEEVALVQKFCSVFSKIVHEFPAV